MTGREVDGADCVGRDLRAPIEDYWFEDAEQDGLLEHHLHED